ncbi:MAG: DoxX family protein [Planctomycetota bacterium]
MQQPNQRLQDLALLALRLMLGWTFFFHGSQKLFGLFGGYGIEGTAGWMESIGIPFPTVSVVLAGSTELLGGLALATGLGQRLIAAPLAFTMLVAAFTAHSGFDATQGGMEYPLTMAVVVAALGLLGPGRLALRFPATEGRVLARAAS